jgi:hypothetical protein
MSTTWGEKYDHDHDDKKYSPSEMDRGFFTAKFIILIIVKPYISLLLTQHVYFT